MINKKNNILNNQMYFKDEITEKDYGSYNYINKMPNKNFKKEKKLIYCGSNPNFQKYCNSERINVIKDKRIELPYNRILYKRNSTNDSQKRGKIRLLEYRPLYNNIEKKEFLNNFNFNNIYSKLNTYESRDSMNKKDNPLLVGRIKIIKLKNKIKNKTLNN